MTGAGFGVDMGAEGQGQASPDSRQVSVRLVVAATFLLAVVLLTPGRSWADMCPNAGLRSGIGGALPDCRAYEQASPVDKGGNSITGNLGQIQSSPKGDAVTFLAKAGIPGGTGFGESPLFQARRGAGAWSVDGMLAPGSFGLSALDGWSPDLSLALTSQEPSSPAPLMPLLVRDLVTGAEEPVLPAGQEPGAVSLAGVDADDSELIFETEAQLLPEAEAGTRNVYAWSRKAHTLSLVDVLSNGSAPAGGGFAGPYNWFTNDDTSSGGSYPFRNYTQEQNVISADGRRVFFTTAGDAQIYMREDPSDADASTTPVSASHKTDGSGPDGADPNGPRPAAFMSASSDGSRVLFTSREELTNDANTGGPAPTIARASIAGTGEEPGFLPVLGAGIAVDGSHVYWANPNRDSIGRATLTGDEVDQEFIKGADDPQYLAVHGTYLYWTNDGEGGDGEGSIARAELGGSQTVDEEFITGANNPQGIAVDGEYIYWASDGASFRTRGRIARANLDGSGVNQSCVTRAELPKGVALDSTYLYWSNSGSGRIGRRPLGCSGTTEQDFITGASSPQGLAVDGEHIYWADAGSGTIGRAEVDGGPPNQSFLAEASGTAGIAVDGAHVYWTINGGDRGNDLYRFEPGSGELSDLTPDASDPNGAEVRGVLGASEDGSYVYFAANGVLATNEGVDGEQATPGDCTPLAGGTNTIPITGACNLYVRHKGSTAFIATLGEGDAYDWAPRDRYLDMDEAASARVTPKGNVLLFRSTRQLTDYENGGIPEFYRYEAGSGHLSCVTCNPYGAVPSSAPSLQSISSSFGGNFPAKKPRNLAAHGDRVFFETAEALVPSDTNGVQDVYEWEADGTGSCQSQSQNGGCLYLISTGTSPEPSYFADAGESGDDVFFFTYQQLVGQDRDEITDVYDARVDGGLAAQNEAAPPPCAGEGCREPSLPASSTRTAASSATGASGNLASPTRCSHYGKRARRLSGRARKLRHHARRAARHHDQAKARRWRRKARHLAKRAKRESSRARQCRGTTGGAKRTARRVRSHARRPRFHS